MQLMSTLFSTLVAQPFAPLQPIDYIGEKLEGRGVQMYESNSRQSKITKYLSKQPNKVKTDKYWLKTISTGQNTNMQNMTDTGR